MTTLFKGLRLINSNGVQAPQDFIFDGVFKVFDEEITKTSTRQIIDATGWMASEAWLDLRCGIGEPGLEYKESIESLCETLQVSGFGGAVVMPNTEPVIQSKNEIEFVLNKSKNFTSKLFIQGAVTKDAKGEDLTEILDMHHHSGVYIFGDGIKTVANADRYMKILQYLQKFKGVLFDHAYDPLLAIFGQMHEGDISTKLGMKGIPNLAEDVAVQRNLEILRYSGGRVHFQTLSTAKGVDLIRQAKKEGLQVTADCSIYQLIFSDVDLVDFDSNFKVKPPFRSGEDRLALIEGLKDGTIDALVSNHQPQDFDSKFMEYDLAAFGMIGLQTFLPAMVELEKELGWELLMAKITKDARNVISVEDSLGWTIFDPNANWKFDSGSNKSLSHNSPWFGKNLTGQVKFVIQKGQLIPVNE
jgi:dihydroorotase